MSDGEPLEAPGVTLQEDPACHRRLSWNLTLQGPPAPEAVRAALLRLGWHDESSNDAVWRLSSPEAHRIILVPATGRTQLRLHYQSDAPTRPGLALGLSERLRDALHT
jgi:hypothetical protein